MAVEGYSHFLYVKIINLFYLVSNLGIIDDSPDQAIWSAMRRGLIDAGVRVAPASSAEAQIENSQRETDLSWNTLIFRTWC
jgi:hypothetical protein